MKRFGATCADQAALDQLVELLLVGERGLVELNFSALEKSNPPMVRIVERRRGSLLRRNVRKGRHLSSCAHKGPQARHQPISGLSSPLS